MRKNYIIDCLNEKEQLISSIVNYNSLINMIQRLSDEDINKIFFNINKFLNNKGEKTCCDLNLNTEGLYIARVLFSEIHLNNLIYNQILLDKYNINSIKIDLNKLDDEIKDYYDTFLKNGIVIIPNFYSDDIFNIIQNHTLSLIKKSDNLKNDKYGLKKIEINNNPLYKKYFLNDKLIKLLSLCSYSNFNFQKKIKKNNETINLYIENLKHISNSKDIQKIWHVDTFHSTCKFWFYIEDINNDKLGSFEYIENSHINNYDKLKYENELVQNILNNKVKDISNTGSLRYYSDENIKKLNYENSQFKKTLYNKNTLIIANTRMIHRRGHGKKNSIRNTIAGSIRNNVLN